MGAFRYTRRTFAREIALLALAVVFCVPIYLVLTISLKSTSQAVLTPFRSPPTPSSPTTPTPTRRAARAEAQTSAGPR